MPRLKDRGLRRVSRAGVIALGYRAIRCTQCKGEDGKGTIINVSGIDGNQVMCPECGRRITFDVRRAFPRPYNYLHVRDTIDSADEQVQMLLDQQDTGSSDGKCREIEIAFLFPNIDDNIRANYCVYTASRLALCVGDGEFVQRAFPMNVVPKEKRVSVYKEDGPALVMDGRVAQAFTWGEQRFRIGQQVPCPGGRYNVPRYPHCAACGRNIRLQYIITSPVDVLRRYGMKSWSTSTTSGFAHDDIFTAMEMVTEMMRLTGHETVAGFRFKLRLAEEDRQYVDDAGVQHVRTHHVLHLDLPDDFLDMYYDIMQRRAAALPALAAPPQDEDEEGPEDLWDVDESPPPGAGMEPVEDAVIVGESGEPETQPTDEETTAETAQNGFLPPVKRVVETNGGALPSEMQFEDFCRMAVQGLGYANPEDVANTLAANGLTRLHDDTGKCLFRPPTAWSILSAHKRVTGK